MIDDATHRASARGLTRDTLIYGIGGSAAQIANILFVPVFTRIFSPEEFGALDFLLTANAIGTLVALSGLNSAVLFRYPQLRDPEQRRRTVASAIAIAGVFGTTVAVLGTVFASPVSRLLFASDAYVTAVALTFVWVPINVIGTLALDLLRLAFRPVAYSVLGIGRAFLVGVVGVILAGPMELGIVGMLTAYLAIGSIAVLTTLFMTRRAWRGAFSRAASGHLLRFGVPLIVTGLAYWVIAYSDRFIIIQLIGTGAAGIYALANRVAMGVQLALYAFEAAWWPFAFARAREPGHRETFARILSLVLTSTLAMAALLGLFAREILLILSTPEFLPAYPYVGLLAAGLVIHGAYGIVSVGAQLGGRTVHMAWTSGLAALSNLALNYWLIPIIGILGAALATVAAYGMSTILLLILAQRTYRIPYQFGWPAAVAVGGILLQCAGLLLDQLAGNSWSLPAVAIKALLVAGCLLGVLVILRRTPGDLLEGWRRAWG